MFARISTKKVRIFSDYNISAYKQKNLNLLHRRLAHSWLLDDSISVHLILLADSVSLILGLTSKFKSLGAVETSGSMNMTSALLLNALGFLGSGSG